MQDPKEKIAQLLNGLDVDVTYRAIGRYVFEFSQLEFTFKHYLAEFIGLDNKHFPAIMAGFDFARLCSSCLTIMPAELGVSQAEAIRKLLKEAMKCNEDRVRVVHSLWTFSNNKGLAMYTSKHSHQDEEYFEDPD